MEVSPIIKNTIILSIALLFILNFSVNAEIYRIGDNIVGTGIEYRMDNGVGVSLGARKIYKIYSPNENRKDKISYKYGIGLRKLFNNNNKVKPYIGMAYIHNFVFHLKAELGLQIKAWDHIAINPAYNFQLFSDGVHITPGLNIAIEF
jgi:hypothetical protein